MNWTPEASERLKKAPFFIRPIARAKVENAAEKLGETTITLELFEKIKDKEMPK